jgi:hypothetical protein
MGREENAQSGAGGRAGQAGHVGAVLLKRRGAHEVHEQVAQKKPYDPDPPNHGVCEARHLEQGACDRTDYDVQFTPTHARRVTRKGVEGFCDAGASTRLVRDAKLRHHKRASHAAVPLPNAFPQPRRA